MYELKVEAYKLEKYFDVKRTDNWRIFDFVTCNLELFNSIKKISHLQYRPFGPFEEILPDDMNILLYSDLDIQEDSEELSVTLRKNTLLILTFDSEEEALYISMKYFI